MMMHEPPVKKVLYWCDHCNVPLIGRGCACGAEGRRINLLQPYDVRPALAYDTTLILRLVRERFGNVPLPAVLLLNKTGGVDRADLVIAYGERFGWLTFDPVSRNYSFDLAPDALPYILKHVSKGIVDLDKEPGTGAGTGRLGGKKVPIRTPVPDGTVIVKYGKRYGTGVVKDGNIRVKELRNIEPRTAPNPDWDIVVRQNRYHLKNLQRNAVRIIRKHIHDRPVANVSFSGGKDSTAVLHLAQKAGITDVFFIDTGIEFPETVEFVRSTGARVIPASTDFWQAAEKAGPPCKDNRWCCKFLKQNPLRTVLAETGPCVTVQGNRWYESWNRADLDEAVVNPLNPLQLNISPIRNWRALEVFLYLWWQEVPVNPLYDRGIERIGCYLCPAMLESEYELLRAMYPEVARRWDDVLERWQAKKGLPPEFSRWGLWRWRALPKKMLELCRNHHIAVNADSSLTADPGRVGGDTLKISPATKTTPAMKETSGGNLPVELVRHDFPILGDIIYLDNAATSFSPEPVISAMVEYEKSYRANVGRGVHRFTRIASQRYWHAHEKVAGFIGGKDGITVFTKNTTEAINTVARGIAWKPGDRIITTVLEHHSNLLPWRDLTRQGVAVDVIGINPEYSLDLAALKAAITPSTRLVVVTHASNVLGVVTPVKKVEGLCHESGALLLVDGAQTVPHIPVDVAALGCDFFCFSGHKMLGPTGTGVLWMKEPAIEPLMLGGGMVEALTAEGYTAAEGYQKYEGGTPNIGGGIALGVAADYLARTGMETIRRHEERLTERLIDGLAKNHAVHLYVSPHPQDRIGVVSLTVDGFHPHEVAQYLDETADIMVRSGHHCCIPLMEHLGLPEGTVRASLALYTTEQEIDIMVATLEEITR